MSDELSGPEDESVESVANWKHRMATRAGYGDASPAAFAKLHFLEVLGADWRSEKVMIYQFCEFYLPSSVIKPFPRHPSSLVGLTFSQREKQHQVYSCARYRAIFDPHPEESNFQFWHFTALARQTQV